MFQILKIHSVGFLERFFIAVIRGIVLIALMTGTTAFSGDWAQWKGPRFNSHSDDVGLIDSWPDKGPPLIGQSNELGEGFSNLCLFGDRIYTLGDFDHITYLVILDRNTLQILAKTEIGPGGSVGGHVGPKSTPTTDGQRVYAINQQGILFCADAVSGQLYWKKNLESDFGGTMAKLDHGLFWGYAESPLLDGDNLICVPGGKQGAVIALDKISGEIVWRSVQLTDEASYASITPVEIAGVQQYLVLTQNQVSGINPLDGGLLWSADCSGTPLAICTDPVCVNDHLFVTRAKLGGWGYRVVREKEQFRAELVYRLKEVTNTHHGLIYLDGAVYSTSERGTLFCFDLKTGEVHWSQRMLKTMVSLGYADGYLLLRDEVKGELILASANAKEFEIKGRFFPPEQSNQRAWTWPIVVDGKMYLRDQQYLFVYDLL